MIFILVSCFNGLDIVICRTGRCLGFTDAMNPDLVSLCYPIYDYPHPYLQVVTIVVPDTQNISTGIQYLCDFSQCNDPSLFSEIETAIQDLYDSSPLFAALNMSTESQITTLSKQAENSETVPTTLLTESLTTTTTMTTTTTTMSNSLIVAINHVCFFVMIFLHIFITK